MLTEQDRDLIAAAERELTSHTRGQLEALRLRATDPQDIARIERVLAGGGPLDTAAYDRGRDWAEAYNDGRLGDPAVSYDR